MKLLLILAACVLAISAYEQIKVFNSAPEPRIISGTEASATDFPYHAALFIGEDDTSMGEQCGGALLTENIVLTAAHCFDHFGQQGFAYFGSNRYFNGTRIPFNRVIVHEDYYRSNTTILNDIALIKLSTPIKIDGVKVKTISLNTDKVEAGTPVTVSGFGRISDWESNYVFYYTNLTAISNEECKQWYGIFVTIGDKVVCAKGKHLEAICQGDSGGAIVMNWPENPIHVGIASFTTTTCMAGYPGAFTRTSGYIDWILEKAKLL